MARPSRSFDPNWVRLSHMDSNGLLRFRHRQSPSSERFLGSFTQAPSSEFSSTYNTTGNDFNDLCEDDIFCSTDFSLSSRADRRNYRTPVSSSSPSPCHRSKTFPLPESFGILAALAEHETSLKLKTFQKASISSSVSSSSSASASASTSVSLRLFPSIPKHTQDRLPALSSSAKFHQQQSAPVNVPVFARVMRKQKEFDDIDDNEQEEEEWEILPPHEIVAIGPNRSPLLACSVLEGAGRTLKGRDLRQVRNTVWRQTGFLD